MGIIQKYFNPFAPQEPSQANYGLCALTHCTAAALKVQNTALKVLSVFLASFFDATIGLGIVCSLSYNSGVLIYNSYGKMKHLFRKEEEKQWNPTALKTWAVIGGSSALLAGLYYFGAFGAIKNWVWPTSQLPLATGVSQKLSPQESLQPSTDPAANTTSDRMWTIFKRNVPYLLTLGGLISFYRFLPDYEVDKEFLEKFPNHGLDAIGSDAIKFTIQKLKWNPFLLPFRGEKVNLPGGSKKFLPANFKRNKIPFLISLYEKCYVRCNEASQNAGLYAWKKDEELKIPNKEFTKAIDEAMKVGFALNCLILEDLCSRTKEGNKNLLDFLDGKKFYYHKYLIGAEGFFRTYTEIRNRPTHRVGADIQKKIYGLFFGWGTTEDSWHRLCTQYVDHFNAWRDEVIRSLDNNLLQKTRFEGMVPALLPDNDPNSPYEPRPARRLA